MPEGGPPGARIEPTTADRVRADGPGSSRLRRYAFVVLIAVALLVLLRAFVVQSFVVPTRSMEPALRGGDRVLVLPSAYRFGAVDRGDVIVFDGAGVFEPARAPGNDLLALGRTVVRALGVPVGEHAYVKRVIGLPGERVACCDAQGRLSVDGRTLDEPWVVGQPPSRVRFDVVVPEGKLWVLGDNRADSADSRAHLGDPGGGAVPVDRIVGKVVTVYWPPSRLGAPGNGERST